MNHTLTIKTALLSFALAMGLGTNACFAMEKTPADFLLTLPLEMMIKVISYSLDTSTAGNLGKSLASLLVVIGDTEILDYALKNALSGYSVEHKNFLLNEAWIVAYEKNCRTTCQLLARNGARELFVDINPINEQNQLAHQNTQVPANLTVQDQQQQTPPQAQQALVPPPLNQPNPRVRQRVTQGNQVAPNVRRRL